LRSDARAKPDLAAFHQRPRPRQRFIDDGADIGLRLPAGNLSFVDVDRVAHRQFHAVEVDLPFRG
jgi:hypothetical protein